MRWIHQGVCVGGVLCGGYITASMCGGSIRVRVCVDEYIRESVDEYIKVVLIDNQGESMFGAYIHS